MNVVNAILQLHLSESVATAKFLALSPVEESMNIAHAYISSFCSTSAASNHDGPHIRQAVEPISEASLHRRHSYSCESLSKCEVVHLPSTFALNNMENG